MKRVAVLIKRSFRQNFRDTAVNGLRLGACGILSFIFSAIFGENLKGEPTAKSVADRTALLSYAVINMAMMSLMKTLDLFGKEKVREWTKMKSSSDDDVATEGRRRRYLNLYYPLS